MYFFKLEKRSSLMLKMFWFGLYLINKKVSDCAGRQDNIVIPKFHTKVVHLSEMLKYQKTNCLKENAKRPAKSSPD